MAPKSSSSVEVFQQRVRTLFGLGQFGQDGVERVDGAAFGFNLCHVDSELPLPNGHVILHQGEISRNLETTRDVSRLDDDNDDTEDNHYS